VHETGRPQQRPSIPRVPDPAPLSHCGLVSLTSPLCGPGAAVRRPSRYGPRARLPSPRRPAATASWAG